MKLTLISNNSHCFYFMTLFSSPPLPSLLFLPLPLCCPPLSSPLLIYMVYNIVHVYCTSTITKVPKTCHHCPYVTSNLIHPSFPISPIFSNLVVSSVQLFLNCSLSVPFLSHDSELSCHLSPSDLFYLL